MINRLLVIYKVLAISCTYRQEEENTGVLRRSTRTKVIHIWMACRTPTIQDIIKQEQDSNTHDNIIMKQKIINSTDENLQVRKHKHALL